jgi:hypothetical protein
MTTRYWISPPRCTYMSKQASSWIDWLVAALTHTHTRRNMDCNMRNMYVRAWAVPEKNEALIWDPIWICTRSFSTKRKSAAGEKRKGRGEEKQPRAALASGIGRTRIRWSRQADLAPHGIHAPSALVAPAGRPPTRVEREDGAGPLAPPSLRGAPGRKRGTGEGRGGAAAAAAAHLAAGVWGWMRKTLRNFRLSVDVRNFEKNFAMIGRTCNGPNVFYGPNSLRPNESHLFSPYVRLSHSRSLRLPLLRSFSPVIHPASASLYFI